MRLAVAQLDSKLGDAEANGRRARELLDAARAGGAELVVFPELYLSGYRFGGRAPEAGRTAEEVAALAADAPAAVIGFDEHGSNSAAYVEDGAVVHVQRKLYLVDYPPFDEHEHFDAGSELRAFDTRHGRMAILICNDAWQPFLPFIAVQDGARVLLMPSCSSDAVPEAEEYWRGLTRFYARMLQCWVVFANSVGREAGFTFWGGSHVVDPLGEVVAEAPRHAETIIFADLDVSVVDERRRELPPSEPRLDLLRRELTRLAREREGALN